MPAKSGLLSKVMLPLLKSLPMVLLRLYPVAGPSHRRPAEKYYTALKRKY
jgi:hypothetical protein